MNTTGENSRIVNYETESISRIKQRIGELYIEREDLRNRELEITRELRELKDCLSNRGRSERAEPVATAVRPSQPQEALPVASATLVAHSEADTICDNAEIIENIRRGTSCCGINRIDRPANYELPDPVEESQDLASRSEEFVRDSAARKNHNHLDQLVQQLIIENKIKPPKQGDPSYTSIIRPSFRNSNGRKGGSHKITENLNGRTVTWWQQPVTNRSFEVGDRVYITNKITPLWLNIKTEHDRKATVVRFTSWKPTPRSIQREYTIVTDSGRKTTRLQDYLNELIEQKDPPDYEIPF